MTQRKTISNARIKKITAAMAKMLVETYGWDIDPDESDYMCSSCGYAFESGDNYCRNCGDKITEPQFSLNALWDAYQAGKKAEGERQ